MRARAKKLLAYFLDLLAETSTLRGIVAGVILFAGWEVAPERLDAVMFFAMVASALLKILLPDKWRQNGNDGD